MIKREFSVNLIKFIIWISILMGTFLMVYLMYPFMITDELIESMDEMIKMFPEEMLKAFNMDMSSISTAYGWLKSEGFTFVLLIIGFYSSFLGANILLKEESDKTVEYLISLPITRSKIITNKIIVAITYIISLVVIFTIFNFISLAIIDDIDYKQFLLLSLTPLFIALPLFAMSLFVSTLMHKTGKMIGICIGMVLGFYLLNTLSELSPKVEFFKYFSIYTLGDVRNVIANTKMSPICIILSLAITGVFIAGTYVIYNKKELV